MTQRLFSIFLLNLVFVSREKEDTNTPEDDNKTALSLIGPWNYVAYVDEEGEELAADCEKNQLLTFEESEVFRFTYFDDFSGRG